MNNYQTKINPSLDDALNRIIAVACEARVKAKSDDEIIAALNKIQGQVLAGEMDYYGPGDDYPYADELTADNDIPF